MAKIISELDTETKEVKLSIDGYSVSDPEFTIGRYQHYRDEMSDPIKHTVYFSLTESDNEGNTYSTHFSFGEDGSYSESYSRTKYNLAKAVAKVHKSIMGFIKLEKILASKSKKN